MSKRFLFFGLTICLAVTVGAESSAHLSFGLRGGGNMYIKDGVAQSGIAYGGMLDVAYTHLWALDDIEIGFRTGCSAGFSTARFLADIHDEFDNMGYDGKVLSYTITASKLEQRFSPHLQVEVPLMLAIQINRIFVHLGAKGMLLLHDTYTQDMSKAMIDAYYEPADVHIRNELITGTTKGMVLRGGNCLPSQNVLLSAEFGYEWVTFEPKRFRKRHGDMEQRVGVGLYMDISPYNTFNKSVSSGQIITVSPIMDASNPPAKVTVLPIYNIGTTKLLYSSFGIKVYYSLDWNDL